MCPQMCWNIWRGGTEASAKNSGGSPDIGYLLCLSTFLSIVCLSVCRLPVVCLLYCSIYRHTLNVASSSSPMVPRTVWLSSSMLTTFARPTSKLLKPAPWSVTARKIKLYVYPHAITLNYSTNSELNSACIVYAVLYIFDAVI